MFDFNYWFYHDNETSKGFWATYPRHLLHGKTGPNKGAWVKRFEKNVILEAKGSGCEPQEFADYIMEKLKEQIVFCTNKKDALVTEADKKFGKSTWVFPMVSVWCNQYRWTSETPDVDNKIPMPGQNPGAYKPYKLPEKSEVSKDVIKTNRAAMLKAAGIRRD